MSIPEKHYLPGIDFLKFILAVLIISAHCQLFAEYPNIQQYWSCLTAIAVPLFFGISSYLFFRKIYSLPADKSHRSKFLHTIKRLVILFSCWYVLMLPMTYFRFYSVATWKEYIFAIVLSCCFNGYWFIKALIINTTILYLCRRTKALVVCSVIALAIYFYCAYNYVYHYNPLLESYHPYYSFYYHTAYFCCGALLARFQDRLRFQQWPSAGLIMVWIMLFLLATVSPISPFYRLVSFCMLFPVFYKMDYLFAPTTHKTMRHLSIILYMVQFMLIWLYNGACDLWLDNQSTTYVVLQRSIVRFLVVTAISILTGLAILKLEQKPRLAFLRYLH